MINLLKAEDIRSTEANRELTDAGDRLQKAYRCLEKEIVLLRGYRRKSAGVKRNFGGEPGTSFKTNLGYK